MPCFNCLHNTPYSYELQTSFDTLVGAQVVAGLIRFPIRGCSGHRGSRNSDRVSGRPPPTRQAVKMVIVEALRCE